jgi:hypothetical protein
MLDKNNAWNLFIGQPFVAIDINGGVPIISFQNLLKLVDANSWPTTCSVVKKGDNL